MQRRAFTMIEMLVVIAVIMVLAGLLFLGGRSVFGKTKAKSTEVILSNMAGMLANLDAKTKKVTELSNNYNTLPLTNPLKAPGSVNAEIGDREVNEIRGTINVMHILLTIPANKSTVEKMDVIYLANDPSTPALDESTIPIPVDSWGNPIIFVPDGGLTDVIFADHPPADLHTVTSKGVLEPTDTAQAGTRPFFASAGEDENFQTGDDNIYSFGGN